MFTTDDDMIDVTDERDTFSPPDVAEPDPADWYMAELQSTVNNLKKESLFGYELELIKAIADLSEMLERTVKPF